MARRPQTPQEKKELAYKRDHYLRGGENLKAWRRTKRLKKRKSVHAYRRKLKRQLQKLHVEGDEGLAARRKLTNPRQQKIEEWGAMDLRTFVKTRRARNQIRRSYFLNKEGAIENSQTK